MPDPILTGASPPPGALKSVIGTQRSRVVIGIAIALGAGIRAVLLAASEGTFDVSLWEAHARDVADHGLVATYHLRTYTFNHPPPISSLLALLHSLGEAWGIPFRILLRLPTSLADAATAWLVFELARRSGWEGMRRHASLIGLAFWLHPVAWIFSAHHGNTDSLVATALAAAALAVVLQRPVVAGIAIGLGLWVKLPVVLGAPALFFALPGWRQRGKFGAAAAAVALMGYAPTLAQDARVLIDSVLLYPGLRMVTPSGEAIGGWIAIVPSSAFLIDGTVAPGHRTLRFVLEHNTVIAVTPVVAFAALRRGRRRVEELAATLTGGFALFYAVNSTWAFQYLAWSLPFWLLSGRAVAIGGSLTATAYVWGLYGWLCRSPWLLGLWDFPGRPVWPAPLRWARNLCWLFFAASGGVFFTRALREEVSRLRTGHRTGAGASGPRAPGREGSGTSP